MNHGIRSQNLVEAAGCYQGWLSLLQILVHNRATPYLTIVTVSHNSPCNICNI